MKALVWRMALYVLGVWICNEQADGYWVVGPVFGLVVLAQDPRRTLGLLPRALVYLAVSTLTWAGVYWISGQRWGDGSDLYEYWIGAFPAAVVAGSIMLPAAHALLLGAAWRRAGTAMAELIASFYAITALGYVNEEMGVGPQVPWLPILIATWQGLYLLVLRPAPEPGPERAP